MSTRSLTLFTLFILSFDATAQAQMVGAETALAQHRSMTSVATRNCDRTGSGEEIIVCAEDQTKFRLPLRQERGPRDGPRTATGEVKAASSERVFTGQCGITQGERVCGGGVALLSSKDSVADAPLVLKALDKLINPNSQVGAPASVPDQYRVVGAR